VAVKLFKGAVTSDGLPQSEMAALQVAGAHSHVLGALGVLAGHPQGRQGLVLPRLAAHWQPLAGPPSMASCSRDVYAEGLRLPAAQAVAIARAAAKALDHLHARGLTHGDVYAHNLLVDGQGGALLSDFGAASFVPSESPALADALRALDRRALHILLDEIEARHA
jgi:DNA-binding helix-hairpin-helix protein with protein kinase domain